MFSLFRRAKPQIHLSTLGADGHGRTTLLSALTQVLHRDRPDANTHVPLAQLGSSAGPAVVQYETARARYTHQDSLAPGAGGALLAVCALDGPMPGTEEQLRAAKEAGVDRIVVALTRCDLQSDFDVLEVIGVEVSMLLDEQGFDGDSTPVVPVAAQAALRGNEAGTDSIRTLLSSMDKAFARR
ncbi:hypothetical protein HUT18_00630 [Streptomyces sp. NA04227]|uniref:GTP-binding protein n=1 Tax=Streptomyces sp. NA04227 TaxID=2742136 RepID=UPI0015927779|nr:GTP-binding protein [Streptomyces sp. NA04227]QKW05082.1 hypothetical protein HUT18_00630 [Streptomyces sp. NA04227]